MLLVEAITRSALGVTLEISQDAVWIISDARPKARELLQYTCSECDDYETELSIFNILSALQDHMSVLTHLQWPQLEGRAALLPRIDRLSDGSLDAGYVDGAGWMMLFHIQPQP